VPLDVARDYKIFPVDKIGNIMTVAIANPFDVLKLDDIRIITGCELRPGRDDRGGARGRDQARATSPTRRASATSSTASRAPTSSSRRQRRRRRHGPLGDQRRGVAGRQDGQQDDLRRVQPGVSDIHIEPFEKKVVVRYRKDGRLVEVMTLPKRMQNNLTSRIKIMSKLDIAEKQKPQDGKFQMKMGNKAIDFRVSILPVVWGEKTVFRILDSSNLAVDIHALGFEPKSMEDYTWAIERPYGMILVTGPTGSGKSTTLYSAVQHIADPEINLITVEDPVEYTHRGHQPGAGQSQARDDVRRRVALDPASGPRRHPAR
jgi:type IV pilus assembly protein PilB